MRVFNRTTKSLTKDPELNWHWPNHQQRWIIERIRIDCVLFLVPGNVSSSDSYIVRHVILGITEHVE